MLIKRVVLVLLVAATGCQEGGEHDAASALEGAVRLTLLPSSPSLEHFEFEAPSAVAWVGDSAIALIDSYDAQIVVLGVENAWERRLGRKGGGPGEFENPVRLLSTPGEGIIVADIKQVRVSQFGGDLQFRRSHPFPGVPLHLLSVAGDRLRAVWAGFYGSEGPVIGEIDLTTGTVSEQFSIFGADSSLAASTQGSARASPFVAAVEASDGTVLVGHGHEYRVVAFDSSGAVVGAFARPEVKPEYPSEREVEEYGQQLKALRTGGLSGPAGQIERFVAQFRERPKPHFYINSFAVDGHDRLWVITSRGQRDSTYVDVFAASGSYLKTLVLRDRAEVLSFRLPLLAVLVERRSGPNKDLHGVDIYRVEESPE